MQIEVYPGNCTGCRSCEVFCSIAHEGQANPALSRILILRNEQNNIFLPIVCPPCAAKLCLPACPEEGAIFETEQGEVRIREDLCTGCCKCVRACEIGAITFHRLSGRGKHGKAVALKCDQCDGDPWCVRVCDTGALVSTASNPESAGSAFARLLAERRRFEALLTPEGDHATRRNK